MLNVDFSINPLTNCRQIAVNGAEERLSECCGSRDIPLEEWKGNCFEVLAKKYNDDVLSVSFTGMAKDFRFLSYLKNGAETEKKLQITLTGKMVYEPERLYRELGEAIREYDASEYDFLHEEYRKIAGGMTEIVFLTPEAGWTSDRLKPLLYDSEKNEYYAERKVTVVDAATADSLPEPEHALYYIHLCDLDGTAFKKSKQYLEKIRSLLSSRSRRTLPDTFFLCEYDFESEEYEDLCDRIDSVLKENTIPLLAFNRESVSEDDQPAPRIVHNLPERGVKSGELRLVRLCIFLISLSIIRVCLGEQLLDLIHNRGRIDRGRPHMLVDLMHRMRLLCLISVILFLLVAVSRLLLHALHMLLLDCVHTVYELQRAHPGVGHGIQDILHPGVVLAAHVDEDIAVLYRDDVLRRRLIGMRLLPRL